MSTLKPKVKDPLEKAGMVGKEEGIERIKDLITGYGKRMRRIKPEEV